MGIGWIPLTKEQWCRVFPCHDDTIKWEHFRVTGPLCGEFTSHRWIPSQRPVTQSFDVSFDLCLNKPLSKQSRRRWFEMPSWSLDVTVMLLYHNVDKSHQHTSAKVHSAGVFLQVKILCINALNYMKFPFWILHYVFPVHKIEVEISRHWIHNILWKTWHYLLWVWWLKTGWKVNKLEYLASICSQCFWYK